MSKPKYIIKKPRVVINDYAGLPRLFTSERSARSWATLSHYPRGYTVTINK